MSVSKGGVSGGGKRERDVSGGMESAGDLARRGRAAVLMSAVFLLAYFFVEFGFFGFDFWLGGFQGGKLLSARVRRAVFDSVGGGACAGSCAVRLFAFCVLCVCGGVCVRLVFGGVPGRAGYVRLALRGVGVGGSFDCAPRARACRRLRTRRGLRGGAVQFAILIDYEKERIQKDV